MSSRVVRCRRGEVQAAARILQDAGGYGGGADGLDEAAGDDGESGAPGWFLADVKNAIEWAKKLDVPQVIC